jgi:hypothetical protein
LNPLPRQSQPGLGFEPRDGEAGTKKPIKAMMKWFLLLKKKFKKFNSKIYFKNLFQKFISKIYLKKLFKKII